MFVQTLARILAGKFGLKVVSDSAARTFFIGKRPDGALELHLATRLLEPRGESAEAIGTVLRGALAHEALGHGRHTDFDVRWPTGAYGKGLANAFEDVRIENLAPTVYPGARGILADMVATLQKEFGFWGVPDDRDDWQTNLAIGLLRKYRHDLLGQPIDVATTETILARARSAIGGKLFDRVDALAKMACTSSCTADVCRMTQEIVDLLAKKAGDPEQDGAPKAGGQQASQGGGGTAGGQDGSDANDDEVDDDASGNDGPGGGDAIQGGDGDGDGQGGAPGGVDASGSGGDGDPQPSGESSPEAAGGGFDADAACNANVESALDNVVAGGCTVTPQSDYEPKETVLPEGADTIPNGFSGRVASGIEESLRSVTEDADDSIADHGLLDTSRLPAISKGFTRLGFVEAGSPGSGIETELMLLFDMSGSMGNLDAGFLRAAIYSTMAALAQFQPSLGLSLAFFDDVAEIVVRPGARVSPRLARRAAASYSPRGSTNWASSVIALIPTLANTRRHRKTLLTITDGALGTDERRERTMRELKENGIDFQFVSIGVPLPDDCPGETCDATQAGFTTALRQVALRCVPPDCL